MEIRHLNKHFILSSVLLSLTLLAIIFPLPALAITYTPLVEGMSTVTESSDISSYINALYTLAISLAALLAVVKIILAGIKYIVTDVVPAKGDAKKDIWGAVIGLLIVLSAVLILNTINPNLTDFAIFKEAIYTEREYSGDLGKYCDTYSRSKECATIPTTGGVGSRASVPVEALDKYGNLDNLTAWKNECVNPPNNGRVITSHVEKNGHIETVYDCGSKDDISAIDQQALDIQLKSRGWEDIVPLDLERDLLTAEDPDQMVLELKTSCEGMAGEETGKSLKWIGQGRGNEIRNRLYYCVKE